MSGDSVAIEIVTQTPGPCPQIIDTFSCIARACPTDVITITPVADICLYPGTQPVDLNVTVVPNNGVGDWSGPGITNTVTGIFDPVLAGAGSHLITFHYLDDGCDFLQSLTINVADPPGAFISNTTLVLTCTSGNLFLDGSSSSGGALTYQWTTGDGVILSGANTAIAEAGAPGTYQLKVIHASGCVDSTSVTVTQDANTPIAEAGADRVITCDSTSFVLGGGSSTGTNIIYTWSTPTGHIVGPVNQQQITADAVGNYTILVQDTANGCQITDVATLTIDTAVATINLTAGDTIDCNTIQSGVQSVIGGAVSDYTFGWSTIDGTIVGNTDMPDVNVSQGGTYVLTIENKNNGCIRSASAIVPESDEIIDAIDVSQMNITCFGDKNGSLVINSVTGGTGPYTYAWSVNPSTGNSIGSLGPGQYSLTVTDQNGCSFTDVFDINEPIKVTLDLGPNKTVYDEDSVSISLVTNVDPNAVSDITWQGIDGLTCPGCPKLEFIAAASGTISAMITDTSGCTAEDSMRLTVIVPHIIYIPTLFSPNDDGINDYFNISGRRNLVNINYMRIYDRWGNLLFDKANVVPGKMDDGWDGKFDGNRVLPGVYVYSVELQYEDKVEALKGGITIVR
jgi:gliding motility-associated-like protein